ncbi:MAG: hypothetical protein M1827_003379 [Pycnora praestabilis]|nr:MAG: hypothetical protein M1827_003379 [Pycnora praestabilis]
MYNAGFGIQYAFRDCFLYNTGVGEKKSRVIIDPNMNANMGNGQRTRVNVVSTTYANAPSNSQKCRVNIAPAGSTMKGFPTPKAPVQTFYVSHARSPHSIRIAFDDRGTTPACTVLFPGSGLFFLKPDMSFHRSGANGKEIGKTRFRPMSHTADIMYASGQKSELSHDGVFTRRHRVIIDEQICFWKGTQEGEKSIFSSRYLKLVNVHGDFLARFVTGREGRLEVLKEGLTEGQVEEILFPGCVLEEKRGGRRRGGKVAGGVGGIGGFAGGAGGGFGGGGGGC